MNDKICISSPLSGVSCRTADGSDNDTYAALFTDESRKQGTAPERIYFPETTDEVAFALSDIHRRQENVTVSGARTGIAGGAVSFGRNLLTLERIKEPISVTRNEDGAPQVHASAGWSLSELNEAIRASGETAYFYPVDPTETGASIGGTIATNASGARTLKYGPTRNWVIGITAVLADGGVVRLSRGSSRLDDGVLRLYRDDGSPVVVPTPPVPIPHTKHTAGYHLSAGMDPIDLFIGGEGTLCVVTEVDLALAPIPGARLCLVLFLPEDKPSGIVQELLSLEPAAVEYMDAHSLDLLRDAKSTHEDAGAVPEFPEEAEAALYVELEGAGDDEIDDLFIELEKILEKYGIAEHLTWAGFEQSELDAMKAFRHALPERINSIIGARKRELPELTKVGTDMAVPQSALETILSIYTLRLVDSGLEYCVFGHIGNAHLHVNILPRSMDEVEQAYGLYEEFAKKAVDLGGSVAGEHGIGRLKKRFMDIQFAQKDIETMKDVKTALDPDHTLNPGVLFDFPR